MLRDRLVPSGASNLPARVKKRPPNFLKIAGFGRQPRSGSIRHDQDPHATNSQYRSFSLVVDPPRQRSLKCTLEISTCAPIFFAQGRYLPSQRAPHARQRRRPMHSWVSVAITHLFSRAQIPIAPAARPRATSRGFLPWRLSDAGPSLGVRGSVRHRPASETLHKRRHPVLERYNSCDPGCHSFCTNPGNTAYREAQTLLINFVPLYWKDRLDQAHPSISSIQGQAFAMQRQSVCLALRVSWYLFFHQPPQPDH